ncbi:MAG: MqnA/MqnD/SBP family protein [Phycisphaerales bacterium]|jgi:1,4-dihydroxy-6-naphthoate synthase|nr:MqnA/MqnD/SBP family protein [Phycisphaerales bacterium]
MTAHTTHEHQARLTLAHSPDADDMVMWWPLVGMRAPDGTRVPGPLGEPALDTGRFAFQLRADDVERLNQSAADERLDITALSAGAYPFVQHDYAITRAGSSFGEGYGPKLVVRDGAMSDQIVQSGGSIDEMGDPISPETLEILGAMRGQRVAVPGLRTTALLVLRLAFREACETSTTRSEASRAEFEPVPMLFDLVPQAVSSGECAAGLLIHEAQIACERFGLRPALDLGQWWHAHTAATDEPLPLPLGLNVLRRDLDERFGDGSCREVAELLARSVAHARAHRDDCVRFLRLHAARRPEWNDDALVHRYLDMYVSQLTQDMGEQGRRALTHLYTEAASLGITPVSTLDIL